MPPARDVFGLACCVQEPAYPNVVLAKWLYLVPWAILAVLSWVLRNNPTSFGEVDEGCGAEGDICAGKEHALRLSLGSALFFATLFVLTLLVKRAGDPRLAIHNGLWTAKIPAWVGVLVACYFFPPDDVRRYGDVAKVGAGMFLLIQIILLLDIVYRINEWALDNGYGWLLVLGSASLYAASIGGLAAAYYLYVTEVTCALNIVFVTSTLVLGVVYTGMSVMKRRNERSGLLTAGLTFLYCTYLTLSALASQGPSKQAECHRGSPADGWLLVVGFFLMMTVLIYGVLRAATNSNGLLLQRSRSDGASANPLSSAVGTMDDPDAPLPYRPDVFHLVFTLASMHVGMVLTSWTLKGTPGRFEADVGEVSTWVKMAMSWASAALYCWTVVAPTVLKDRSFE